MLYLFYLAISIFSLVLYLKLANRLGIVDKPNRRSSHTQLTILGGGIIFPLVIILHFIISGFDYPYFNAGLLIVSFISFYDDLRPVSFITRLVCHLVAVSLIFVETELVFEPLWVVLISFVLVIGTTNAYNFMDGINGLTAAYSLTTVGSLLYVNEYVTRFVLSEWLVIILIAIISFSIFNFRRVAKCFAGDVGSVSMAFIVIFFILTLILQTENLKYIAFLLVYGLDTVTTIIFRIIRGENIFLAHRSHFYQYLANVKSWPHLFVSSIYAFLQLIVNIILISTAFDWVNLTLFIVVSGLIVVVLRLVVEGKDQILRPAKDTIRV